MQLRVRIRGASLMRLSRKSEGHGERSKFAQAFLILEKLLEPGATARSPVQARLELSPELDSAHIADWLCVGGAGTRRSIPHLQA